jgi:hypothetical protein
MSITIKGPLFRFVFERIAYGKIPIASEMTALVQLAEVVAGADLDVNVKENAVLESLVVQLARRGRVGTDDISRLARLPIDREERRSLCADLASQLDSREMRELAYTFAYLLLVADFEASPVAVEALEDVEAALGIDRSRASELALFIAELVTPGFEEQAHAHP